MSCSRWPGEALQGELAEVGAEGVLFRVGPRKDGMKLGLDVDYMAEWASLF